MLDHHRIKSWIWRAEGGRKEKMREASTWLLKNRYPSSILQRGRPYFAAMQPHFCFRKGRPRGSLLIREGFWCAKNQKCGILEGGRKESRRWSEALVSARFSQSLASQMRLAALWNTRGMLLAAGTYSHLPAVPSRGPCG